MWLLGTDAEGEGREGASEEDCCWGWTGRGRAGESWTAGEALVRRLDVVRDWGEAGTEMEWEWRQWAAWRLRRGCGFGRFWDRWKER